MVKGSCLCGQVTICIDAPLKNMTHCHCSICRKIHGSLFATYAEATDIAFTSGSDQVQIYQSSQGFERVFCKTCGSVLPESSAAGNFFVPVGLLDDDPGIRPQAHIFVESKSDYYDIHDALPQHEHYGDGDISRVVDTPPIEPIPGRITGGCQCGDVAFFYTGELQFVMNCHCSRCRKAKSAAHATNAFVAIENFTWEKGHDRVVEYKLSEAERFGHCFCGRCGSSVPRQSDAAGIVNIPVGSLNQAPGTRARGHIFTGSKAPWFDVADDLPQWTERPT